VLIAVLIGPVGMRRGNQVSSGRDLKVQMRRRMTGPPEQRLGLVAMRCCC